MEEVRRFRSESLYDILTDLDAALNGAVSFTFEVPNPELASGLYAGESLDGAVYRPLSSWLELAQDLRCRMSVPVILNDGFIRLSFHKLDETKSFHGEDKAQKYSADSTFSRINKLEDSSFLSAYLEALKRVGLQQKMRVLSLGVNRGDELLPFDWLGLELDVVGIDLNESALQVAKRRFGQRYSFITMDLNDLGSLKLNPFDLILSFGTLQSPALNDRALLRELVQRFVTPTGSLILGLPNGRYLDGELLYGAKMKNYARPDLSLLIRDAAFYRKYLQQHGFKVFVTGKYEVLLTAVRS